MCSCSPLARTRTLIECPCPPRYSPVRPCSCSQSYPVGQRGGGPGEVLRALMARPSTARGADRGCGQVQCNADRCGAGARRPSPPRRPRPAAYRPGSASRRCCRHNLARPCMPPSPWRSAPCPARPSQPRARVLIAVLMLFDVAQAEEVNIQAMSLRKDIRYHGSQFWAGRGNPGCPGYPGHVFIESNVGPSSDAPACASCAARIRVVEARRRRSAAPTSNRDDMESLLESSASIFAAF